MMRYSQNRIQSTIRDVRNRWRRRALVQGASLTIGVLVLSSIGLLILHGLFNVPSVVLLTWCALGLLATLACGIWYVGRPAFRRVDDQQIAMLIEESVPELEDRLISAVELEDSAAKQRAHQELVDRLIDDAADRTMSLPLTAVIDHRREKLLAAAGAAGLIFLLVAGYTSFDGIRWSLGSAELTSLVPAPQPYMSIEPGDAEIEQGGSQDIVATLREESDVDVVLNYRQGDGEWVKEVMQPAVGEPAYLHEFLDVQEPISYFVEHDAQRSDVFEVSLYTFPSVEQIDLTYVYPEYTQQSPRREEATGDIYGLRGSTVSLDVQTNGVARNAELILDDGNRIGLEDTGDGTFRGRLRLDREGSYRVRLLDSEEKENKFPQEYRITVVDDERPFITITDPQRDVRANAVEEVLVAARAQDDYGVDDVRLRYAVNAGEEQVVSLAEPGEGPRTDVEGEHVFFLEDFSLQPGDVVSYFIEADDAFHDSPEMTDMYFIEVIPFDQEYTQTSSPGGMSGGQSGTVLSQQQIIAATWKLYRQEAEMPADEYASSRRDLARAQESLRQNIDERIGRTAFSLELQQDEDNQRIVELLRQAVDAMSGAVKELEADRLRQALTPEREALNYLLKANAMNTERRVALNRGGQSSAGGSATEERMTELMDLELDISKDKYEMLPESSGRGAGSEVDETLQNLRELARRQQNLANENRHNLQGEDRKRQVERLQREQNELRRQTQSMTLQLQQNARQQGRSGEEAGEAMERVARNMQEAEKALREGDTQRAQARQRQALNELEQLTRDLRRTANDDGRESLEDMRTAFDELQQEEARLARSLERASENSGSRTDRDMLDELARQRNDARGALERLEREAQRLSEGQTTNQELAAAARNIRQAIQREAVDDQMRDSEEAIRRGWLDNARRRQESIARGIERLEEPVRALDEQLPVTDEERLARSLDALQELEEELRGLEREAGAESSADQRDERAGAASRRARLDRARQQLRRLQEDLGRTPALNELSRAVSRADHEGVSLVGEAAESFFDEEVFAPLSQLEQMLTSELDRLAMERKLYGSRPGDVPPEYRDIVEKYYESLSKTR